MIEAERSSQMNKETRRVYLEFIQDRIQSALDTFSVIMSLTPNSRQVERDLQAAQEKLELLLNEEEEEEEKPV